MEFMGSSHSIKIIIFVMIKKVDKKGSYPENLMLISQLELCQEGGSFMGLLGGHWGFLTGDLEDMVIPEVMDDLV